MKLWPWVAKETRAEHIRRKLHQFNEENLPLAYMPELDTALQHTPPLGLDVNIPYLLAAIIPKQRTKLEIEKQKLLSRLLVIDKDLNRLTALESAAKSE
jgi:hypothetical protein